MFEKAEMSPTKKDVKRDSLVRFVVKLNAKEWKWILIGLICSILAGLEEWSSAMFSFGELMVAISNPRASSRAGFWAGMFLMLRLS